MPLGPVYGTIQDPATVWAAGTLTAKQVRETIRTMMSIPLVHASLKQLSDAMDAAVELSAEAVASVKGDVVEWAALEARVAEVRSEVTDTGLPLIKADVIEYSEEPLKSGKGITYNRTQPLREAQQRIEIRISRALALCSYGLTTAPDCGGGSTYYGISRLGRS
jgi:hypothetical protein